MKATSLFRNFFRGQLTNLNRQCSGQIKKYDEKDKIKQVVRDDDDDDDVVPAPSDIPYIPDLRAWDERSEIKLHVKKRRKVWHQNMTQRAVSAALLSCRDLPVNPQELRYWLARRKIERDVLEQEFIRERVILLRPDLAAAHFIYHRGGAIKFYGDKRWVGLGRDIEALPSYYVPGLFVEYIDAVGCRLQYEGLMNLMGLVKLKWLNLSGNEHIDNWCMDLLSGEYGKQMEHLDISNCLKVDHKGMTPCYRFEKLKTLNVTGIALDHDFKMACSLLEDLIPELDIIGVDYSIPDKEKFSLDLTPTFFN